VALLGFSVLFASAVRRQKGAVMAGASEDDPRRRREPAEDPRVRGAAKRPPTSAQKWSGQPRPGQPGSAGTGSAQPQSRQPRSGQAGSRQPQSRRQPPERAGQDRVKQARQVQPPADADPRLLDPEVRRSLRSLVPATADRVAAHLVAVAQLMDDDPAAALEQARAARALASRIGLVREAAGLAAYAAGEWHEALAELRAERRLTGSAMHLPVMADCQRGLRRPERALDLASSPEVRMLDDAGRVELAIVTAGARQDLGQPDAALVTLESVGLERETARPWSSRLWYAYAEALLAAGRREEARSWFAAVADVDEGETDAEERLLELEEPPRRPGT
jgi:tetratricopeptide (TPR) repeat protein